MNCLISILLLGVMVVVLAHDKEEDRSKVPKYTEQYDNIDLDSILNNERILRNYIDCCLDKKPCTADGLELKKHIRDAMDHECDKCSEKQKKAMKKVGRKLYNDKPEWWKELCDHFDPKGNYRERYQKFIDEAIADKA